MRVIPKTEFSGVLLEEYLSRGTPLEEAKRDVVGVKGIYWPDSKEIIVPSGSTTALRLHEVGHKKFDRRESRPTDYKETYEDFILGELDAEIFSYEARGKRLTSRVARPAIWHLVRDPDPWPVEAAVFWVTKLLKDRYGISTSKLGRRELVKWAHGYTARPYVKGPGYRG